MIIETVIFLWLGLALLFTLALCWVARDPIPQPGGPDEVSASSNFPNPVPSTPTNL